ncbi:MAG: iron ABC transporter permease [Pseudomonadales bacterium]|nr:iron ABC transporter permease [Pseudomonadales bacterium]
MTRASLRLGLLVVALVVVASISLLMGPADVSILSLISGTAPESARVIVTDIRLPRTLLALLVGAGVATSGACIQGLFRNPLADPALIGVSSGAALFAAGFLVFGGTFGGIALVGLPVAAFVGGLAATLLVLEVGRRGGTISAMLLAGVAINAIAIAGVGLFSYLASDLQLRSVAFWALGSVGGANWRGVAAACVIPVAIGLMWRDANKLNAITLGDAEASHLGISVAALRRRIVVLTAFAVGIGVSLTGVIAFVGLVVPHLVRLSIGSNHRVLIPGAALLGAILLVLADCLGRIVVAPAELPIGILTALLGGPFFIYLIVEQKGKLGI